MSRNTKGNKKEKRLESGNRGRSNVTQIFTDPNFFRKESGKFDVPSPKFSDYKATTNSVDIALICAESIPQDQFGSFQVEVSRFYQSIRRNNSANAAYTMADLAAYILNVRSVRATLTQLTRTLRLANNVDKLDTGVPPVYLGQSMGLTTTNNYLYQELMANSAAYFDAIAKINRLVETSLPTGDFAAFRVDDWLNSTVFRDSPGAKYSAIMVSRSNCACVGYTTADNRLSSSEVAVYVDSVNGFETMLRSIAGRVVALASSYTNALIAGDIQHAMGSLSYHSIVGSDQLQQPVEPIYDVKFLRMFKNATPLWSTSAQNIINSTANFDTGTVVNSVAITEDNTTNHSPAVDGQRYIDGEIGVSIGDVATSLYLSVHGTGGSTFVADITAGIIPFDIAVYHVGEPSTSISVDLMSGYIAGAASSIQSTAMSQFQRSVVIWTMVDWMPQLYYQYASNYNLLWDMATFARITTTNLDTYISMLITSMYDTAANAVR